MGGEPGGVLPFLERMQPSFTTSPAGPLTRSGRSPAPALLVIGGRDFVRLENAAEMLDLFSYCRARRPAATRHSEVMESTDEVRVLASSTRRSVGVSLA
jgi:hypothetical protein